MKQFLDRLRRFWFRDPWQDCQALTPAQRRAAWRIREGRARAAQAMRDAERLATIAIQFGRFADVAERIAANKTQLQ